MTTLSVDEDSIWWRCEIAWSTWLQANQCVVTRLTDATGNAPGTNAPLIFIGDVHRRAPDLLSIKAGATEYWEIKFRSRSNVNPLTGNREHWMAYDAFRDYYEISHATGCKVWVALYEGPNSESSGRWLRTDVRRLSESGRRGRMFGQGGEDIDAWIWPVAQMDAIDGPAVDVSPADTPILPEEGTKNPLPLHEFAPLERQLRCRQQVEYDGEEVSPDIGEDPIEIILESDLVVGLDVLRRTLGIPALPRYSVLRIGLDGTDIDELLGLLHYGIRVFLISGAPINPSFDSMDLMAFKDSRLLEYAVVHDLGEANYWVIDGVFQGDTPEDFNSIMERADTSQGINVLQYRIVHAPADSDTIVTAGAGTGKTETMAERLVFLLATSNGVDTSAGYQRPFDLRLDEVVLVTFSREAAREMRSRIARTMMLRRRLSRRCVLPALAWLMQLSGTEISTIHSYAKKIAQQGAGVIGLAPGFQVSQQTLAFRELLYDALSSRLYLSLANS